MTTNKEKIERVYALNAELQALLGHESDLYKKATDNRATKLTLKRGDKDVEVTEGELWEELRITGNLKGEAGQILRSRYTEVFEAAEKREAKNKEMQDYIIAEFGFDFRQMSIADYMKLTEAIIDYKMGK